MITKKFIFGLILLFGFMFSNDEFLTREFTIKDGFIGGTINDIFQDHHDRIWFCTTEGVSIFDAEEFTNFSQSHFLPSSHIECGIEDTLKRIWLGTQNGLVKIEKNITQIFTSKNGLPSSFIKSVIYWNNQLWVGTTQGIAVFFEAENQFRTPVLDFRMNHVSKLYIDNNNKLWIGSSNGLWTIDKSNKIHRVNLPDENLKIWEIIEINGVLYVSTEKTSKDNSIKYEVYQVHHDLSTELLKSNLWFRSAVEIPEYGFVFSSWDKIIVEKQSLTGLIKIAEFPYAWITATFQDIEGNTWFGSKDRLFFVNDKNIRIRRNNNDKFTLSESSYSTIVNGNIVITGSGKTTNGVYFDKNQWKEIKNCPANVSIIQYSKYFGWLVASDNGFLGILDPTSWKIRKCNNTDPLANNSITGIVDCKISKKVLITTQNSIYEYNGTQIQQWQLDFSGKINRITEWNNKFYLGCDNGLFSLCVPERGKTQIFKDSTFFSSRIVDMNVTDSNTLLVLEENQGYEFYSEQNYKILHLPKVKNQKFRSILKANDHVWVSTLASILHFHNGAYTIFDIDCGMVTTPILQWLRDKLWILSYNGVVQITPEGVNPYIPETIIYSVQTTKELILDTLILPININNVKFKFSMPSFASIGNQKYKYRLCGLDDKWKDGFGTKIDFMNLPTGEYCLEVMGFDRHGRTSITPARVFFKVSKSKGFLTFIIVLTLLVVLSTMAIFVNLFANKKMKKMSLLQKNDEIIIRLFDSFSVVKNGQIVTNILWQGKQSKEILFFLILKDFHHKMGVDINEFNVHFWPDASISEVMNRKNTAISRIRSAVKISDQKVIVSKNNRYSFDWADQTFKIDLLDFQKHVNDAKNFKICGQTKKMLAEYEKAVDLFGNGISTEFSSSWCDDICEGIKMEARNMVLDIIDRYFHNRDYNRVLKYTKIMMTWDYLDEVAIEYEVNSLKRIGKPKEAKDKLRKFKELYLEEIGEKSKIEIS